jgi:DNA invertase Pin-like site-specific DNA recombinase
MKKVDVSEKLIFINKAIGAKSERPGIDSGMQELKEGDNLVIWGRDWLGRSLRNMIDIVEQLQKRGVGFRSINDGGIDTTTASGEMIFNIFGTLAQFERRLIQGRTQAGLTAARARGRKGGRPKISKDGPKVQMARKMTKNLSF